MFRGIAVALIFVVTLPVLAQSNENLHFAIPSTLPKGGEAYTLGLRVGPIGPETAGVVVDWTLPEGTLRWIDPRCVPIEKERTFRCTIGTIVGFARAKVEASIVAPTVAPSSGAFYPTKAIFVSPAPPHEFPLFTDVEVRTPSKFVPAITIPEDEQAWLDQNVTVRVDIDNVVPPAQLDFARVRILVPALVEFTAPEGWSCSRDSSGVTCDVPNLTKQTLYVVARRDTARSHDVDIVTIVDWRDRNYRDESVRTSRKVALFDYDYLVTSEADAGDGSLRAAMHTMMNECTPFVRCRIRFAENVHSIALASPLPLLDMPEYGTITIDGSVLRAANEKVAIDGSALTSGEGFSIGPNVDATLRGLAIHSFAGDGIECNGICQIFDNYIGLDAGGFTAPRPNLLRGIVVRGSAVIERNVISGNGRSGIWVETRGGGVANANLIGVAADGVTAAGNGASGVFILPQDSYLQGDGTAFTVTNNVIANSVHFGIAIARPEWRFTAINNRFANNRINDIDLGLDGAEPATAGVRITRIDYDPSTSSTWIYGNIDWTPQFAVSHSVVAFYAPGASLGSIALDDQPDFVFHADGDLRGVPITANRVVYGGFAENPWWQTTEMSEAAMSDER